MTIGSMVMILIGSAILALIAGIVTRSIFIGILFPVLLLIFIIMWRSLKKNVVPEIKEEEIQEEGDITEEAVIDQSPPPVSTNYPPTS